MTIHSDPEYLTGLVHELRNLPHETEWVEFKTSQNNPQDIGEYISALSNGAAINGKPSAYLVWGIEDNTHAIVGTTFSLHEESRGNAPLEHWLSRRLNPRINFQYHEIEIDGRTVALMVIDSATDRPVAFDNDEFIRVGSVKTKLREHPERERTLWRIFDRLHFEDSVAAERVGDEDVLLRIDYPSYFELLGVPLPDGRSAILDALEQDNLIAPCDAGGWNITNLGAILFAKNIIDFPQLRRKALRVVQYKGTGRIETLKEQSNVAGYAVGFKGIIEYIMALIPSNEVIEQSLRTSFPMFPELAVRELVANALIHQDFLITGAGPMVEMFDDRIEITSPGEPLVDTDRFVDTPPRSRNETLASLMRRFGICEERGSGIDKVVSEVEAFQLPAPLFESPERSTRATLFAHKRLNDMDRTERVRACYLHACLCYVLNQPMNNASLRKRFGISERNASRASRILGEAVDSGSIVIRDPNVGSRIRTYLPYWVVSLH